MKTLFSQTAVPKMLTGIQGFDEITGGGLPLGRTTLVMGGPGCGKTVFALQSLVNSARRGREASIFVAFEESARHIIANASTFGWDLPALVKKKLFFLDAHLAPEVVIAGEFDLIGLLNTLQAKAEELHATRIVFDGIDVLLGLLDDPAAERREIYRIRDWLSRTGLTGIITQKVDGTDADHRYMATGISTIADTWIHVSYVVQDGERNRALTIVKSRGTGHSNQVRELTLSNEGVTLTDVFIAQGKVLMGVARWEWEQEEHAVARRTHVAAELKRLQLQLSQAEAAARLQVVQTEMEARSAEIAVLVDATGSASQLLKTDRAVLRKMRHADEEIRVARRTGVKGRAGTNGHREAH